MKLNEFNGHATKLKNGMEVAKQAMKYRIAGRTIKQKQKW